MNLTNRSRRSLLIILAIVVFALIGLLLLRRSVEVSARRTGGGAGGGGANCIREGSQGESPLVCCAGLSQLGEKDNFTCTKCGNGKCGPGETQLNCSQDCKPACMKEGARGELPLTCCRGLTQLGIGSSGFICTKCGNRTCGTGETESNCPQDCRICGNGKCDRTRNETWLTCPSDCQNCGNGRCESQLEENASNCPNDCGCGNGQCDNNETWRTCMNDCQCPPGEFCSIGGGGGGGGVGCGDGQCFGDENILNCPEDCDGCGDGRCNWRGGEDYINCPTDCEDGLHCGDGKCDTGLETRSNCPQDCSQ